MEYPESDAILQTASLVCSFTTLRGSLSTRRPTNFECRRRPDHRRALGFRVSSMVVLRRNVMGAVACLSCLPSLDGNGLQLRQSASRPRAMLRHKSQIPSCANDIRDTDSQATLPRRVRAAVLFLFNLSPTNSASATALLCSASREL